MTILLLTLCALPPCRAHGGASRELISRIMHYASQVDSASQRGYVSYAYTRSSMKIERKNPTLLLVPSVYTIAHRVQREYLDETYSRVVIDSAGRPDIRQLLRTTTIPHRHHTMTSLLRYLTPRVYDETVIDNFLLSPFHPANRLLYRYQVGYQRDGTARITFVPKRKNTQLVTGDAIADYATGRIIRCSFSGEYDMVRFWITLHMGRRGLLSLMPQRCELRTRFSFLRSVVSGHYVAHYDQPPQLDTLPERDDDLRLMAEVRPDSLTPAQAELYRQMEQARLRRDSIAADTTRAPRRNRWVKEVLWDMIGDNVLNRVKTHFGTNHAGYLRLNPILNPLYMGYDHRRGFTYKLDVRGSYQLGDNSEISARIKAGYAFKQKQLYWRIPIFYYFDKLANNYIRLEANNGNHIHSASVRRDIERRHTDTAGLARPDFDLLNEFKHREVRLLANYNFSSRLSIQLGALYQCRTAVHKQAFSQLGWQYEYRAFSPLIELQYRPWGWQGPILSADYDRSFRHILGSNTAYERIEFNAEYIHRIHRLRSLQLRAGAGFYTQKDPQAYFLNYENFQQNNIPGGWNDDWSGEFELLRGETYNDSEYYLRANLTYESPMLLLSWLPWGGRFLEMERLYVSALDVRSIHPYVELGYGFTTRLFSCGLFVSSGQGNRTFGCKFGFELFRHW